MIAVPSVAPADGVTVTLLRLPEVPATADFALLSTVERERAARFQFERDQASFVTTRAALRRLLGAAIGCEPAQVRIGVGEYDRPMLAPDHAASLDFNVSHSGRLAAIALSSAVRVGVDVEWHARKRSLRELVPQVMGRAERELLDGLEDPALFERAFYACWTRKEAIVKGIGVGISHPLTSIDVPVVPADNVVIVDGTPPSPWYLVTDEPIAGYTVSVALAGTSGLVRISLFENTACAELGEESGRDAV